jgi:rsbT co-antagonist protein RsbR
MDAKALRTSESVLLAGMDLTEEDIARRKAFLEFREDDVDRLRGLNDVAEKYADSVIEDLYEHFLSYKVF